MFVKGWREALGAYFKDWEEFKEVAEWPTSSPNQTL
jgi:hypothetical protein